MNTLNWGLPTWSNTSSTSTSATPISSLAPLPPEPPKFPSVAELIEKEQQTSTPSVRRGLFQELLQGRPEEMYVDSVEHPEKYSEELRALLSEMVSTRRQPTSEESLKLDAAVLDFVAAPRPKDPPKKTPSPPRKLDAMEFKTPDFAGEGGMEVPGPDPASSVGAVRAFWWL